MIVNNNDAVARLASPMNLINRLRRANGNKSERSSAMSLFCGNGDKKPAEIQTIGLVNPFLSVRVKESVKIEALQTSPKTSPEILQSETLDNILENHESQIKLGLAHDEALKLLNNSIALLSTKLDDVKADRLPSVISAASKTVESIRRERNEVSKNGKDKEVHYHFYTPQQKTLSDYEIIDVT